MTSAQTAILEHATRAYAPRSVLVRKTTPEHQTECAKCGARVDPTKLFTYQLCDRCLGINHDEPRVKYGEDSGVEAQAAAFAPRLEAVITDEQGVKPFSSLEGKDDDAPKIADRTVADTHGVGELVRTSDSHGWNRPPTKIEGSMHKLSEINEDTRIGYCKAHGYRVPVQVGKRVGDKVYWRCGEASDYIAINRRASERFATYKATTND